MLSNSKTYNIIVKYCDIHSDINYHDVMHSLSPKNDVSIYAFSINNNVNVDSELFYSNIYYVHRDVPRFVRVVVT